MKIEIIDPTKTANWDNFIIENFDPDIFHTAEWARVLNSSYNFKPLYFLALQDHTPIALIPLMEVKSFLMGTRGVSLPFTDFCTILMKSDTDFSPIIEYVILLGRERKWKYVELRSPNFLVPDCHQRYVYFTHEIELTRSSEELWKSLKDNNRRNIKKAIKEGLKVKFETSIESLREFYRLQVLTRKRHGLPPQPFIFFKEFHREIISTNMGTIASIYNQDKMIAGAIFIEFNHQALFKFGASDEAYHQWRPNNLLLWEALIRYKEKGNKVLNLGRTSPENSGLLNYKRSWGGKEYPITYTRYHLSRNFRSKSGLAEKTFPPSLVRLIPDFMLRLAGNIMYKHFG